MIQSPILRRLVEANPVRNPLMAERFWREMQGIDAPLIEDGADVAKRLVTFIYRGDSSTRNVALLCCINRQSLGTNQLQQYGESNLWYQSFELDADLRTRYLFSPNDSLIPLTDDDVFSKRSPNVCVDPLNPKVCTLKAMEDDPDDEFDTTYSVLELPDAPSLDHTRPRENVPHGMLIKHRFTSDHLTNDRSIWVYTPPDKYSNRRLNLLIVFDGWNYTTVIPTPTILDNLIEDGRIAPTVALFVDHDTWESRELELTCNEQFAEFLAHEIIPWAIQAFGVTDDPKKTTLAGSSYGGLAACFCALTFPDLFGNVVAQSCSAMWNGDYIIHRFESEPLKPIRIYLDIGRQEYVHSTREPCTRTLRQFRDVLATKKYDFVYNEFNGGHDYNCWAATLSMGLTAFS